MFCARQQLQCSGVCTRLAVWAGLSPAISLPTLQIASDFCNAGFFQQAAVPSSWPDSAAQPGVAAGGSQQPFTSTRGADWHAESGMDQPCRQPCLCTGPSPAPRHCATQCELPAGLPAVANCYLEAVVFRQTTCCGSAGPCLWQPVLHQISEAMQQLLCTHLLQKRDVLQQQGQSVHLHVLQLQLQYWTLQMVGMCCSSAFTCDAEMHLPSHHDA